MKLWQPVLTAAALLASGSAWAETATGDFKTTIVITKTCEVNTNTGTHEKPNGADIDFGSYTSSHTAVITDKQSHTTGGLSIKCSKDTPFKVGLQPKSTNSSDGSGNLINGGNEISYKLYQNEGRTEAWGNIVDTNTKNDTGKGFNEANVMTVYGKVEANQFGTIPAGRYNDTVTVTVTY